MLAWVSVLGVIVTAMVLVVWWRMVRRLAQARVERAALAEYVQVVGYAKQYIQKYVGGVGAAEKVVGLRDIIATVADRVHLEDAIRRKMPNGSSEQDVRGVLWLARAAWTDKVYGDRIGQTPKVR